MKGRGNHHLTTSDLRWFLKWVIVIYIGFGFIGCGLTYKLSGQSARTRAATFTTSYLIEVDPNENNIIYLHEIRDDGTRGPTVTTIHQQGSPLLPWLKDWKNYQIGLAVVGE